MIWIFIYYHDLYFFIFISFTFFFDQKVIGNQTISNIKINESMNQSIQFNHNINSIIIL